MENERKNSMTFFNKRTSCNILHFTQLKAQKCCRQSVR